MPPGQPTRILALGSPDSGVLQVLKELTGSTPPLNNAGTTAGLTHEWHVETAYYKATIPIWIDEITDAEAWRAEFSKAEAAEVVEAVGAWVFCFRSPGHQGQFERVTEMMGSIADVVEAHGGGGLGAVMLAVGVAGLNNVGSGVGVQGGGGYMHEQLEQASLEHGFEYVDYAARGTNEFGEKTGFERVKEALEANEWVGVDDGEEDGHNTDIEAFDLITADDMSGSTRDEAEMTAELFGMKAALSGADDLEPESGDVLDRMSTGHKQVEQLDMMLSKLLAVKEKSAGLPEAQRKRMAAKAVRELMGDTPDSLSLD